MKPLGGLSYIVQYVAAVSSMSAIPVIVKKYFKRKKALWE